MKHTIVGMDQYGRTVEQYPVISDWSEAVKACGRLNARLTMNVSGEVAGYEVVSESEREE